MFNLKFNRLIPLSKYNKKSWISWFHKTLGINNQPNSNEIQTNCPQCGYENFFFNTKKEVGICHKAKCHWRPTADELIEYIGFAPDEWGIFEIEEEDSQEVEISIPDEPLLEMVDGQCMTSWPEAVEYLSKRGVTWQDILRFDIRCDTDRIYVPIKYEGKLVNYNSRSLTNIGKKYLYAPGVSTSKYIFGWDECKLWDFLTLVENTFVSIWLRNSLNCSTVFGSSLSEDQANLILNSKIKTVVLFWDENTEKKCAKACELLASKGIQACYIHPMKGQPDDYSIEFITNAVKNAHLAAKKGIVIYNPWEDSK